MAANRGSLLTASGLRLDSLSRFNLPVRDLDRAELFYTEVVGAIVVQRVDPGRVPPGGQDRAHLDLKWGPVDLSLWRQSYGGPTIDAAHPHHAFTTSGSTIDTWVDHFAQWGVPSVIVCRQHGQKGLGDQCAVEVYFMDPDGNQLELDAGDYIFSERVIWAPYNHWDVAYDGGHWWAEHKHLR